MVTTAFRIACIIAASTAVGAFQPLVSSWQIRQGGFRSRLFSTSLPSRPSTVDVRNDTEPGVTVEVVRSNAMKATAGDHALVGGPAYVASLEKKVISSDNRKDSLPVESVVSGEQTSRGTSSPSHTLKTTNKKARKSGGVRIAASTEELLDIMNGKTIDDTENDDEVNDDALTLILFHAHYCKICQRAGMQLNKACKEYPAVGFAKVESQVFPEPVSDSLRTLGVSKFPFVQIYRRGQCVASFSTGPTHMFMRKIRDTLDLCLERDEDCWDSFVTDFAAEIESNQLARKSFGPTP